MPQYINHIQEGLVPFNPTKSNTTKSNLKKKFKKSKTQRRKLNSTKVRKTCRVKINLSDNMVNKYHCPDLKPKWELDIEAGKPMTGGFKVKKMPYIALKDLFD